MLDGAEHVVLARDRLGEAALRHIGRHRQARRDRLVLAADGLVEAAHEMLAEARGERRARAVDHVGDALRARPARASATVSGANPQRGERQREQGVARLLEGSERAARSIAPSRGRRTRHRCVVRRRLRSAYRATAQAQPTVSATAARAWKPCAREPRHDVAAQRLLAAEQMRAAGDVEQEPVRRIEADQRRVAVAPVGDRVEHAAGRPQDRRRRWRCAGYIARASASAMPGLSPSRAAASLTAASRSAPFTGSATTSGAISRRGRAAADQPIRRQPPQPHRQIAPAGGRRAHGDPNTR